MRSINNKANDPIGNRLTSTGLFDSSYITNELNQYTELSVSAPPREPIHDADGNLVDNGAGWTYSWNAENRLIQATDGTTTLTFTYDYQGRLVKKDDEIDVEIYVYDGWNRIATFEPQVSGLIIQVSYLWGLDLSGSFQSAGGVGGLLREGDLYPLFDANGNIMQKLDDSGAVVMSVTYDPFGNIIDGELVGEYGFSTKPLIADLNWYYYGFRYYDPETGRWPSRDPIEEAGGLNLYGMVANNPVNAWDYLGLFICRDKCDREGERRNVEIINVAVSYSLARTGRPVNLELLDDTLTQINRVSMMQNAGGVAKGVVRGGLRSGVSGAASDVVQDQAEGLSQQTPGDSSLSGGLLQNVNDNLAMNHSGVIHVTVQWEECRSESCCVFWDRLNWQSPETGEHQCSWGNPPFPLRNVSDSQLQSCFREAINRFGGGN